MCHSWAKRTTACSLRHACTALTVQLALADESRHGGGGHDGVLAHQDLLDAVGGRDLDDQLGRGGVVVPPITPQADGLALHLAAEGVEQGLDPAQTISPVSCCLCLQQPHLSDARMLLEATLCWGGGPTSWPGSARP